MHKTLPNLLLPVVIGLFSLFTFNSCSGDSSGTDGPQKDKKLKIVTTTGMIRDGVENIVGDKADVEALMGPGVDPHLYKATQGDLKTLNNADVILYNGLHLEGKMGEVFEKMGRFKPVIPISEGLPENRLRRAVEFGDAHDPHLWFNVDLWAAGIRFLADTLGKLDEKNSTDYQKNADSYSSQLDSIHNWIKSEVASLPEDKRVLITAHDAFGYFGLAYGMEVKGLQGISTLSEFGLKDVTDLVNFIVDRKIKAVFVETSVSEKSINAVVIGCRERGHEVKIGGALFSDAMGADGTPEGTYMGMVKANVNTIVTALK